MENSILHFITPPIPYFLDCGSAAYVVGDRHINRDRLGVFDLIVVTKGALAIGEKTDLTDHQWELQEREALILRPDAYHYGVTPCIRETEIIWVHFQTFGSWRECKDMKECLECQTELIENHRKNAFLHHCEACSIFIPKHTKLSEMELDILRELSMLDQEPQSIRNWKRQATFQLFIQHLDRDQSTTSDGAAFQIAEKIDLFIRQNYTKSLSNTLLQQKLNYHPNYLARCMLKIYGMTPMEYLTHYRIEQAKKLLLQTDWPVSRISEEIGFNHASYFSTSFIGKEGISPSAYRAKLTGRSR
ncbi:AraC-like DNA-binding protein [Fontibacillus solani]|uniref:AraC-like DNA-binding protein n=1 Tax=Fontibacillus solani TaxID=1572857 RepID=A0A7W3SSL6_9BACL|nr:response regulator transcription factor [Fontibacillus solani]MBA9085516.1 AraC-like DNA-binding protein [Fontibacillus solani]